MRKNKKTTKERKAEAKRGLKKFTRKKRSRDGKHIRADKRKKVMVFKAKKIDELINKLSGDPKPE